MTLSLLFLIFFFFNDTATTEIYTLSLHDALPISILERPPVPPVRINPEVPPKLEEIINKALEKDRNLRYQHAVDMRRRSEEHTSELQSRLHLVCRLLLEKKKKHIVHYIATHQRAI